MKKKLILFLFIFFLGISNIYAKEKVKLSKCVDGDTIKIILDKKEYTVRMLAVDTPESVHPKKKVEYYGKEASKYTCDLVTNAKKLEIEYDDGSDKTDKYGRLLVWVFADNVLVQQSLVENGYAKIAYLYGDYKYTKSLEEYQVKASNKNLGVWDETAKKQYNDANGIDEDITEEVVEDTKTSTKEIVLVLVVLAVSIIVGNKSLEKKATKKLKKYLK